MLPTVPTVPAPVLMPMTCRASPSASVSLSVMTLPLGLMPASLLSRPPASTAVAVSSLATGASLRPRMMILISARSFRPPWSVT
ncbi:hypothetical protein D3C80_1769220 [compost metagenome]